MEHAEFERMIEAQMQGSLPHDRTERLHEHLRECVACARLHQRYVEAEKALCGSPESVSILQLDRIEERLLQRERPRRSFALPLGVFATAAAMIAVFALRPSDEFVSRGGASPSAGVELRALAVQEKGAGFEVHPASERPLRRGDHVSFGYRNDDGFERVTVELVGAGRRLTLVRAEPVGREGKLGDAIEVSGDWPVGAVEIRAVFFRGEARPRSRDGPAADGNGWAVRTVKAEVVHP